MSLLYKSGLTALMTKQLDLTSDALKVQLIDAADYTAANTDAALDDIPVAARVGNAGALNNKTVVNAVFDADNVLINNVTGDAVEAALIYLDTGTQATSTLIAYLDNDGAFSYTPVGNDVVLNWNASGIFAL